VLAKEKAQWLEELQQQKSKKALLTQGGGSMIHKPFSGLLTKKTSVQNDDLKTPSLIQAH